MKSEITPPFLEAYRKLPPEIRERARHAYKEWRANVKARRFKAISKKVSVRVDRNHRALGRIEGNTVYWYWIGKHDEYERKLDS